MPIGKKELIEIISEKEDLSKAKAGTVLNTVLEAITSELCQSSGKVTLPGFGTFQQGERAERIGKNPRTGEALTIPAAKTIKFKSGKGLKDAVNQI